VRNRNPIPTPSALAKVVSRPPSPAMVGAVTALLDTIAAESKARDAPAEPIK
jgi:hypothetical protein